MGLDTHKDQQFKKPEVASHIAGVSLDVPENWVPNWTPYDTEMTNFLLAQEYQDFQEFLLDVYFADKEQFDDVMRQFDEWNNKQSTENNG